MSLAGAKGEHSATPDAQAEARAWADRWERLAGDAGVVATLTRIGRLLGGVAHWRTPQPNGRHAWVVATLETRPGEISGQASRAGHSDSATVSCTLATVTDRERARLAEALASSASLYLAALDGRVVAALEASASAAHVRLLRAPLRWDCSCETTSGRSNGRGDDRSARKKRCEHAVALSRAIARETARDPALLLRARGVDITDLFEEVWRRWGELAVARSR